MKFLFEQISIEFLYENVLGRFFLTEEGRTLWTCFQDPYKSSSSSSSSSSEIGPQVRRALDQDAVRLDLNEKTNDQEEALQKLRRAYILSVPFAKLYRNLLLQGYCVSPKFLLQLNDFEIRKEDVFIVSYPRSGTTWTEEIVSAIHSEGQVDSIRHKPIHFRVIHLEVGRCFGQRRWLDSMKSPRLLATHLPLSHVPQQLKELKCKVIYVARNPKDQAVSYYHFHRTAKYLGGRQWDWSQFLSLYESGDLVYGGWFDHVLPWYQLSQKRPDRIHFLTYEQLSQNLGASIASLARFLGRSLDASLVQRIAAHCSFAQMKDNTSVNRVNVPIVDFFDQSQVKFMRKGVIGDWKNHFNSRQSNRFDRLFEQRALPTGLRMAFTTEQAELMYKHNSHNNCNNNNNNNNNRNKDMSCTTE